MKHNTGLYTFKIYVIFSFIFVLYSCKQKVKEIPYTPPQKSKLSGKELANAYCGNCHLLPEPDLLPKAIWKEKILPQMAFRLGIEDSFEKVVKLSYIEGVRIAIAEIYPPKPAMHVDDYKKIFDYYIDNAPEIAIPQANKLKPQVGIDGFLVKRITVKGERPSITLTEFSKLNSSFYVAGINPLQLYKFNKELNVIDSLKILNPVSDILQINDMETQVLEMGEMDPQDNLGGILKEFSNNKFQKNSLIDLQRPVEISKIDVNNDGQDETLILQFGNELGRISWFEKNTLQEHLLKEIPGARNAIIKDVNGDKLPDILVLMTQAKEGILLFTNKGNGHFDEKQLLAFPAVYGSSYFELADFNGDGHDDLLYTNGDNADLSIGLKAFHGVRIFLNDGKFNFSEKYFYPMHGASKALSADFDLDGDLDIAAISFFTDPKQKPNEGFLYFENTGNLNFKIKTIKEADLGNWMTMDVGDLDSDGDKDIILGSFINRNNFQKVAISQKKNLPSVIFLENKKK